MSSPTTTETGAPPETAAISGVICRTSEIPNDFETVRQRKDGTLVDVSIAAAPVRDSTGRVVGNMVAYTDIRERRAQAAEVHRLNDELHARLAELAASRARIVTAGDVERRRLERNLHDGAQQRLVTLALSLQMALAKLESDPAAARAELTQACDEVGLAIEELRELARGLHPAVLTRHGLRAAVAALAGRATVPVEVVEVPDEEFATQGPNVLALAPRVALALDGNPETLRRMERMGVDVRVYRGDELSHKGEGGPTCLTRPLLRASA